MGCAAALKSETSAVLEHRVRRVYSLCPAASRAIRMPPTRSNDRVSRLLLRAVGAEVLAKRPQGLNQIRRLSNQFVRTTCLQAV